MDRLVRLFDQMREYRDIVMPLLVIVMVATCLTLKLWMMPQNEKQEAGLMLIVNCLLRDGIGLLGPSPGRKQMNKG